MSTIFGTILFTQKMTPTEVVRERSMSSYLSINNLLVNVIDKIRRSSHHYYMDVHLNCTKCKW